MSMMNQNQQPVMAYNWNQPTYLSNQTPPMANMQNMAMQQMQQQISFVPGRSVNASEEVQAFEVPMNYPYSVFTRKDMGEIYVKYWNEKGVIDTKVYRLVEDSEASNDQNESAGIAPAAFDSMQKQLNRIEKILKQRNSKPYQNRSKQQKEDDSK